MIITAKFPSTCPACGSAISVGSKVQWERGAKATHANCGEARPAAKRSAPRTTMTTRAPRAQRAPRVRREPSDGETIISSRTERRVHRFEVGQTTSYNRGAHIGVVVSEWVDAPCEDNGDYDWMARAIVRPATEAEIAAYRSARAELTRRQTLASVPAWVASQVRASSRAVDQDGPRVPAGAWHMSVGRGASLYATAKDLYYVEPRYDDAPGVWRMPLTSAMIDGIAQAIEVLS